MVGRSRSPRMQPRQKALPAPPQQLAPEPQPARRQRKRANRTAKKGRGKGDKHNASTQLGGSSSNVGWVGFDQPMKMGQKVTKLFHSSNKDQGVCFNFQKRQCGGEACLHRLRHGGKALQ